MTDHITPETDAKLADAPQPSNDSPDYARALEIHIHLLRAELADERAKKSDALIAAVDDIERLTAERDDANALARNYAERMKRSDADLAILIADRGTLRAALEHYRDCAVAAQGMRYVAREALTTPAQ